MNESTWDFLGIVAQEFGLDWARKLRDEIAAGTFVDCGWTDSSSSGESPPLPPLPQAAGQEQLVLDVRQKPVRMGRKHG